LGAIARHSAERVQHDDRGEHEERGVPAPHAPPELAPFFTGCRRVHHMRDWWTGRFLLQRSPSDSLARITLMPGPLLDLRCDCSGSRVSTPPVHNSDRSEMTTKMDRWNPCDHPGGEARPPPNKAFRRCSAWRVKVRVP